MKPPKEPDRSTQTCSGQCIQGQPQRGDGFELHDIVLNGNGSQALIVGCDDATCSKGRISLLDTVSTSLLGVVTSHESAAILVAYKADFTRFITASSTETNLIERSSTTGTETQSFTIPCGTATSLPYSFDGSQLAVGTSEGTVVFFATDGN